MAQTAAQRKRRQRARDRARLGDKEYKRIEAEKMRRYRASKRPPPAPPPPAPPAPPAPQQQQQPAQARKKAPQQLQRAPQQVIKDYVPMYKKPNASPISDNSIST